MKVQEYITSLCSMSLFHELASDNEYWQKALDFYQQHKDSSVHELSRNQMNWLRKIKDQLIEEAIK